MLLSAGQQVRTLGRAEEALAELRHAGAEIFPGDTTDADFLTEAFRGADAAYTLLPTDRRSPDYLGKMRQEGEAIAAAIRQSGVRFVVALSSLGADQHTGTGLIAGLHEQEERLKAISNINLLFLRPASFFENFYDQLPLIHYEGIIVDSVGPDVATPMVASRDIADVAARTLQSRDWTGVVVRELLGQRDLTHREVARIIGERVGKPDLPYHHLSYEAMAGSLVEAGLLAIFAEAYVSMTRAFNEGRVGPGTPRTPENTTPTPFEDFADTFARAYAAL